VFSTSEKKSKVEEVILMIRYVQILPFAAGILLAGEATAECNRSPVRYLLRGDSVAVNLSTGKGETCNVSWRVGGKAAITSSELAVRPKNGQAAVNSSGVLYTPKAGFAGPDAFSVKLCGSNQQGQGCSTLQFTVAVQ
jgi:hypothetical protein